MGNVLVCKTMWLNAFLSRPDISLSILYPFIFTMFKECSVKKKKKSRINKTDLLAQLTSLLKGHLFLQGNDGSVLH